TLKMELTCYQSNHEGEIIEVIQKAKPYAGLIINPGAFTHTSIAIMDALLIHKLPIIEVHLSNIFKREEFRHESYVSKVATGVICGLGSQGYLLALSAMAGLVKK
ncbi:MAG: type II 3-dehydroquinate dehydratase, partial [Rickettsiales bacterium]|nr:type II 3-dehydroquinate dehydratase [Rickettsiales bacterium]